MPTGAGDDKGCGKTDPGGRPPCGEGLAAESGCSSRGGFQMAFSFAGPALLVIVSGLIYLGLARGVLDRMRLTGRTALLLAVAMLLGQFLPAPSFTVAGKVTVQVGSGLIPAAVAVYLLVTAGGEGEKTRALLATAITAALILVVTALLPPDPGVSRVSIDPIWRSGLLAGIVGYTFRRSRRSAFIAGTGGVLLVQLVNLARVWGVGEQPLPLSLGGAGAADPMAVSGILAVLTAEGIGQVRQLLAGRKRLR